MLLDYSYVIEIREEPSSKLYIAYFVINLLSSRLRELNLTPLIRVEIEIRYIGREYAIEKFVRPIRSLVLSIFVDGFRIYRNIYRAILGVYLNYISLPER